ncbi:hypothetical protein ATE68_03700 [Sphingopyxis sp. H038]|uniref:hypothetical protein n=1 Tax=unclassified Sphingopyxis TaxID=2614943 RepID=UPI00073C077C|nr:MULTISPECIES: hypothetical protein [unclassified Sphingopyxis]KTE35991.1 hypothetical protein ATE68_03700 [Sphingopyxis sp. H038]
MIGRSLVVIGIAVGCVAMAAPATAKGKMDALVECMWQESPTSTARYIDSQDKTKEAALFMRAVMPCGGSMNIDLKQLKKRLAATRPSEIRPDKETDASVVMCTKDASGEDNCAPVEE